MRGAHLGYVAHEIRNPMSTALWTAELLGRLKPEERAGARGEKLSALCFRSLNRVRLLVEDHLLCERLDAGGYPVRPERLVLAEVVEALLGRRSADEVPVARRIAPGLAVHADKLLLERAIDGLVGAAEKDCRLVELEAAPSVGGRATLRVMGGPVASLEDPHKGAPSDQRGRSLALPMARRVAVALGGELRVDGTAYSLSIPLA